MNSLFLVYLITLVFALAFLLWTYAPRGKKWLKDL